MVTSCVAALLWTCGRWVSNSFRSRRNSVNSPSLFLVGLRRLELGSCVGKAAHSRVGAFNQSRLSGPRLVKILKLVDHYLLRSYGERDIRLLKHRSQRRDIEALGKCATVGFLHFVLDFCKGFGYAKTLSVFQHETDRCASRSGLDEYPLPDPTRTFILLPEPDPNYF